MATVRVTALKDFNHAGKRVKSGSLVTMAPVDASIAARRGEVSLDRGVNARSLDAETAKTKRSNRRYRRRDMEAER